MYGDYKQFGFDEDYKLKYSKLFCDMFATDVKIFKLSNPKVVLAPSFAWRELFSSDKRHERSYFFPG